MLKGSNFNGKNLKNFGAKLTGLRTLKLYFEVSPESKDIGDSLGLVELLPSGSLLDQVELECPKSYHALSLLFFYETSLLSKRTIYNVDALRVDTDLAGSDKLPTQYLSRL